MIASMDYYRPRPRVVYVYSYDLTSWTDVTDSTDSTTTNYNSNYGSFNRHHTVGPDDEITKVAKQYQALLALFTILRQYTPPAVPWIHHRQPQCLTTIEQSKLCRWDK